MSSQQTRKTPLYFCLCIALLGVVFYASLPPRVTAMGWMSEGAFEDQTARTLKFARNWYRDGIASDYFLQLENPASVEFTELTQRVPYVSFLPGTVMPVYLLALAYGHEPDIDDVQRVNLLSQFLASLLLAIATWLLSGQFGLVRRCWATLFVGVSYIYLPFLLYHHQQVYYTDTALMLPYAAFICAVAYYARFPSRWSGIVFASVLAFFVMVDWFGAIAGMLWAAGRLLRYRHVPGRAVKAVLPVIAAGIFSAAVLLYHIYVTNMFSAFVNIAHARTKMAASPLAVFLNLKWSFYKYMLSAYDTWGTLLLLGGSLLFILLLVMIIAWKPWRPTGELAVARLEVAVLAVLAPWLTLSLIPLHFHAHDFSPIRFAVPVLLFAPVLLADIMADMYKRNSLLLCAAAYVLLIAGTINSGMLYNKHGYSWFNRSHYVDYSPFQYLHDYAAFNDIIFSPNYNSEFKFPTQDLAMSMKRVYKLDTVAGMVNYTVEDFKQDVMGYYAFKGTKPVILPLNNPLYMLVLKQKPCWPLSIAGENFLKQHGELKMDTRRFSYYAIKPADYSSFDVRFCD